MRAESTTTMKTDRKTIFSEDRVHHYTLWRDWDVDSLTGCADDLPRHDQYLNVIGLNPSTADEKLDDNTIRRCINFAKTWGFGAFCMTNLFAFRSTKPDGMRQAENPVGQDNDHHIRRIASSAGMVLCAWGNNGVWRNQDLNVMKALKECGVKPYCLRITKMKQPEHPLYMPKDSQPIPFEIK